MVSERFRRLHRVTPLEKAQLRFGLRLIGLTLAPTLFSANILCSAMQLARKVNNQKMK